MVEQNIQKWVKLVAEKENLRNCCILDHSSAGKGDGYMGNVTFVTIKGKTDEDKDTTLSLVFKSSKESEALRKQIPVKQTFENEIYLYNTIKTHFDCYQKSKKCFDLLDFIPELYLYSITNSNELLVLENLKPEGYNVWNRKIPFTQNHLKLVLQAYGQWHALSFAFKTEKPIDFEKLAEGNQNMHQIFVTELGVLDVLSESFEAAKSTAINAKEEKNLLVVSLTKSDIKHAFVDLCNEDKEDHVFLHGDCWTNNYLFKHEEDLSKPLDVKVIDWQCFYLGSPAMDLSHLIYSCCDTQKINDVSVLLKIYYSSLKTNLKKLGFQANAIYSYDKLVKHWKKYSRFGFIFSTLILKFSLCDSDEAPDFAEAANDGIAFEDSFSFEIKNQEQYIARVRNNFFHYAHNYNNLKPVKCK